MCVKKKKKRKNNITVSTEQEPGDSWGSSLTYSFSSSRELCKASSKHHRTNQSMKIKSVVSIKNQSFNEETALTACNNLFPLPTSPLHVTQVLHPPSPSFLQHTNIRSWLSLLHLPLLCRHLFVFKNQDLEQLLFSLC